MHPSLALYSSTSDRLSSFRIFFDNNPLLLILNLRILFDDDIGRFSFSLIMRQGHLVHYLFSEGEERLHLDWLNSRP